ncbi:hypothetical protein SAMN02983003_1328 [Devosia enhydra]|uniref:Cell division protein FtsL n=1 Tax=Devosia enhydra TaxID=665118 RepID=A0A1K2HVN1_9HYPH|nr:hypothetical protein [Devosia enhydra]SFZ82881.1 hypothetical protein SAMN02983003_1328 [Devosia enhydra]
MIRTLNVILVCTSIAALVGVYGLKYAVEETASTKVELERLIDKQQADLSMLKADWAYLNQPSHVAPIVVRHEAALGLKPVRPEQFGRLDNLPMRKPAPDKAALDALFEALDSGIDPIEQLIIGASQ